VYKASRDAIERARAGGGPSFIEAVTYRLADHTTADDARRYRDPDELEAWKQRDPVIRRRKYLTAKGLWSDQAQEQALEKAKAIASEVAQTALNFPAPGTDDIFDYTYATLPKQLEVQKKTMQTHSLGQDPEQAGLSAAPQHA
jgi:TPP-dependent pyruvate/acetoin dehydrogenase alpha subunit